MPHEHHTRALLSAFTWLSSQAGFQFDFPALQPVTFSASLSSACTSPRPQAAQICSPNVSPVLLSSPHISSTPSLIHCCPLHFFCILNSPRFPFLSFLSSPTTTVAIMYHDITTRCASHQTSGDAISSIEDRTTLLKRHARRFLG
jgi:hypothetical protein